MGNPEDAIDTPQTTAQEVLPEDEPAHVNGTEHIDGAFYSIVISAALPCGLVVVVTAILLGLIYGYEVDPYKGWPDLYVARNSTTGATGVWATLNNWKKYGGDAAIFVNFNPSSLTTVAGLTGKIIPYLSSSIMALVAFFVARRIILISKEGQDKKLLTPTSDVDPDPASWGQ